MTHNLTNLTKAKKNIEKYTLLWYHAKKLAVDI